ncbi:MAG: anthranilate synthase component I family protein [Bacteroidota bacterium]
MSNSFDFPVAYLNSNDGSSILAFGEEKALVLTENNSLVQLTDFIKSNSTKFIFGAINYNVKNEIEQISSSNCDETEFPQLIFFVPSCVVKIDHENFEFLQGEKSAKNFEFLNYFLEEETDRNFHDLRINWISRTNKENYIQNVTRIKEFIHQGEVYEMNYCQEFYAENCKIEYPLDFYFKLNEITKAPFSAYFQFREHHIFCGSPERFLKKEGNKLISQPIKGTARRSEDPKLDEQLKNELRNNPKERAENIMIVDLVRNDLSKVAEKNSVQVEELCEIYSFETVHQMISTVTCEVKDSVSFEDIIKAAFPMGSMTGAPKLRAMQLIDELEDFSRGIYSGSIGYISPNGDFDFNVVIRSMIYNANRNYISCPVGGAITLDSDPEQEYQECQTKISRILDLK